MRQTLLAIFAAVAIAFLLTRIIDASARAAADDFSQKLFRSIVRLHTERADPKFSRKGVAQWI